MGVMRIGHVALRVLDLDRALHHYETVLGLQKSHVDARGTVYLKGWDEWDLYSVSLTQADRSGVEHIAYKVEKDADLDTLAARVEAAGARVTVHAAGHLERCGRAIGFTLPSGHLMYLYADKEFRGKSVGTLNPEPWPDGLDGAAVHWLDHVMLMCPVDPEAGINTVEANVRFLGEALDFHLAEQVLAGPDHSVQAAAWLFRGCKPHDLAMAGGPVAGLHHVAFYLDSWHDVLRAADVLGKHKVKIDVTPQRHGITRGQTTYFFDPSGNRNEMFAGLGYYAQPDMPPITWHAEEIWRGIFYHQGEPRPDFIEVYT
ncbi:catechol 1,2-dioxygenase [Burkholderia cepacia]|nr:catechol 1,2-dioxygenase [Burkholderia cepacia]